MCIINSYQFRSQICVVNMHSIPLPLSGLVLLKIGLELPIRNCFALTGSDSLDLTELNDLNVPDDIRGDKWESWYQEQNFEETASWYGDVSDGRSGLLLGLNNTTEENSVRMPGPDDVRVGCQRAPGEQLSEDTCECMHPCLLVSIIFTDKGICMHIGCQKYLKHNSTNQLKMSLYMWSAHCTLKKFVYFPYCGEVYNLYSCDLHA